MAADLLQYLPNLGSIVDRQILTVEPEMLLVTAIGLMRVDRALPQSAALVVKGDRLVGILTESDIVRLASRQRSWRGLTVGEVMVGEPHVLKLGDSASAIDVLEIFCRHQIRHLPILDDDERLLGMVTPQSICRGLAAHYVIVDFSLSPICDDRGQVVMLIPEGRDITARKETELALQASESRFRALLAAAPVGIFQADTDGNCAFVNERGSQLMGIPRDRILGRGWLDAIHPDDRALIDREWLAAVAAEREFSLEHRFLTPTGQAHWVSSHAVPIRDEAGRITGYLGTTIDITDRKIGERKIAEQAALLDIVTDGIIVCDLDGWVEFWNQAATQIYGWKATEAIGQPVDRLFYPHHGAATAAIEARSIVLAEGTWQGELHQTAKDGHKVIVASRWHLVRDESGAVRSILSVDTDITEKKQLEQQFLRAQRLESLGTLASGIAHDLNNMLTPILGVAQLLPHTLPNLDARHRRLLDMLLESARRGSGLVKQILTFARGMDGERTAIQVRHILTEIVSVARQTFPKSIEISLNLPAGDSWLVNADATQIHQVIMNLFVNARDALPAGGKITASIENTTIANHRRQRYLGLPVGSYIKIAVADTGIGMNEATIDRIFDPFYTTKATGTGLGLSTVSGIIRAHGGTIDVESEPGTGSCFNIYLPASDRSETPATIAALQRIDDRVPIIAISGSESNLEVISTHPGIRAAIAKPFSMEELLQILAAEHRSA